MLMYFSIAFICKRSDKRGGIVSRHRLGIREDCGSKNGLDSCKLVESKLSREFAILLLRNLVGMYT